MPAATTPREPTRKPPRKSTSRQMLTDLRRSEIIAAALKVFARKGFHNTRAEDVAAQARIAKGTLYLYFESKEAIYDAALTHAMASLLAMVEERVQAAAAVRDQVRVYVEARLEFWGRHADLYRMVLTVGRERPQRKRTAAILSGSVEHLVSLLQAAIASGELRSRPIEPIAWVTMDLIRGSLERRIDRRTESTVQQDAELITEIVMRYFAQ